MTWFGYVEADVSSRLQTAIRPEYTPHARAERVISTGRLVLASVSLAAVWLEPSTPAQFQHATYSLLAVYTVYAFVTALVAWRSPVPAMRWRIASHLLDLLLFTLFVYLTEGPASPFFLYFVFSLFCATLRFSWRGILATAVVAIAIYGGMTLVSSLHSGFDPSRAMIRITYLGVIAALLVHLGIYQERLRAELSALAAWPRDLAAKLDDALRVTLSYAATLLRAKRLLLLWEDSEEPWVWAALLSGDHFEVERVPPGAYDSPAPDGVRHASVFVRDGGRSMLVYDPAISAVKEVEGEAIGPALAQRYAIRSAIVVSMQSETLSARLIVPDVPAATADDLTLAHVSGRLVLATLEQFLFLQQVRQTASTEERLRISRDLHDGIVQSLAGVGLRLHAVRAGLKGNVEIQRQLEQVQAVVESDQRDLRAIVRELRPHDVREGQTIIEQELRRMRERFPLEWGLEVDVNSSGTVTVPPQLARDICRIVNESLSNAARHGGASRAVVSLGERAGSVGIVVADNGHGFPFEGRFDLSDLERNARGPRTLKERVRNLHGSMLVSSSPAGASIEISIPLREVQ